MSNISASQYTLAEALRDAGYATGHIGKWHLGTALTDGPTHHGFDLAIYGTPDARPASYHAPYNFPRGTFTNGLQGEYITERITQEAINFIEANQDRPFFLQIWHFAVHSPWGHQQALTQAFADQPPGRKHDNVIMASMIKSIDDGLGEIMETIESLGIADRTVVIFTSDNGGNTEPVVSRITSRTGHPRHAEFLDYRNWAGQTPPTNNAPLRGGKGTIFEGGTRVPLVIRWPSHTKPRSVSADIVSSIDFYPTILEIAGVTPPARQVLDGISQAGALNGEGATIDRPIFSYQYRGRITSRDAASIRKGDWKLILWPEHTPGKPESLSLYHLSEDPGERSDVALTHPEKVKELRPELDSLIAETGHLFSKPNPRYIPTKSAREATRTAPGCLRGWTARNLFTAPTANGLALEKTENPAYLALGGLSKLTDAGPYSLEFSFAEPVCCSASLQWRARRQTDFAASKHIMMTAKSRTLQIVIPEKDRLKQLRFFPPLENGPAELRSVSLADSQQHRLGRWEFATDPFCPLPGS